MKESDFQARLINELRDRFEGCVILKLDSSYLQGIPDLLVLYHNMWAVLECKASARAPKQPNQDYYIELLGNMSFAAVIFPSNKEQVLGELQRAFGLGWSARVSKRL